MNLLSSLPGSSVASALEKNIETQVSFVGHNDITGCLEIIIPFFTEFQGFLSFAAMSNKNESRAIFSEHPVRTVVYEYRNQSKLNIVEHMLILAINSSGFNLQVNAVTEARRTLDLVTEAKTLKLEVGHLFHNF